MSWVATNFFWPPIPPGLGMGPSFQSVGVIDATGEKMAWCGRIIIPDGTAKSISRAGFRFGGSITKAGGSALTVSLQDVSLTTGPVGVPDETQDQTVAIANANASFAASTWIRTGTFNANRSMSHGDLVALVVEFDGSGRLGADTVNFSAHNTPGGNSQSPLSGYMVAKQSGTWALVAGGSDFVLEDTNGDFFRVAGAYPMSASNNQSFNSGSGSDERAAHITLDFPCKVNGLWFGITAAAGADWDAVLYSGTTALAAVSVDSNAIAASASARLDIVPIPEQVLQPGTYYISAKPTTANSITTAEPEVAAAGHFAAWDGGNKSVLATRADLGSWSADTTTRRPMMGLVVSALSDGGFPASRVQLGM